MKVLCFAKDLRGNWYVVDAKTGKVHTITDVLVYKTATFNPFQSIDDFYRFRDSDWMFNVSVWGVLVQDNGELTPPCWGDPYRIQCAIRAIGDTKIG